MHGVRTRRLGVVLGSLYLLLGVIEVGIRLGDEDSLVPLLFWGPTLFGAAAAVLVGTLAPLPAPRGAILIGVGVLLGLLPTMWTLVIPAFGVVVTVLAFRDARPQADGTASTQA